MLGGGLVALILLESIARIASPERPWLNDRYVKISRGFAELDSLIVDVGWKPGPPPRFYEEFLYGAPPTTTGHLNVTEYYSARWTPDSRPLAEADDIVWTFGGSTMQNTETTDSLTIANTWARMFNRSLGPTHVKNFGNGAFFSSPELIQFQKILREVPASERPTIAIFYDGYNDAVFGFQYGPGAMQRDLSLKLAAVVERRHLSLMIYSASELLGRLEVWNQTGRRMVEQILFPLGQPSRDPGALPATVQVYLNNVAMARGTCEAFGIHCFFVLQPLLLTKDPLTPLEGEALNQLTAHPRFGPDGVRFVRSFYDDVVRALGEDPVFIDASDILDGRSEADFYDIGHVGALTPPVIGNVIGAEILARLHTPATATASR